MLAFHTGMRRGELLGLKWEDVDLDNATVRIRRTLTRTDNGRQLALGEPKTKKSRRNVRLTPRVVEALRRHWARQAEEKLGAGGLYGDQGLVFATETGSLINLSNLRQRSFAPLLKRAGLPHHISRSPAHLRVVTVPEEYPPEVRPRASKAPVTVVGPLDRSRSGGRSSRGRIRTRNHRVTAAFK